jgi:hypothetical protein
MPEISNIPSIAWKGLEYLGSKLSSAAEFLFTNRRAAFLTASFFALLGCVTGFWCIDRADFYQRIVETALSKETENTPQSFKALEALILSDAEGDERGKQIEFKQNVQKASISEGLAKRNQELDEVLRQNQNDGKPGVKSFTVAAPSILGGKIRQQDSIITEANDPKNDVGFLFLPARILHLSENDFDGMIDSGNPKPIEPKIGLATSSAHPPQQTCGSVSAICDDLLTTRKMLPTLQLATQTDVATEAIEGLEIKPSQVYVITENGLNRMVSQRGHDSVFYRNQFRASTVFPARPYYVGAFQKADPKPSELLPDPSASLTGTIGKYFYVSDPYLDLGGNGIVVTLSRAFRYPKHSDGAVCFDVLLKDGIDTKLEPFVRSLGGPFAKISCNVGLSDTKCNKENGDDAIYRQVKPTIESNIAKARKDLSSSDVMGSITFVTKRGEARELATPAAKAGLFDGLIDRFVGAFIHPMTEMEFIVPDGPPVLSGEPGKETLELRFLAASLKVGDYLEKTAIAGAVGLCCLGIALTILLASWATEGKLREADRNISQTRIEAKEREKKDLEEALENVATVMMSASIPYVRLDNEDRILDGNPSLAAFFGLPADVTGVERLKMSKLRDRLADRESEREYDRVQQLRRTGRPVTPYPLTFKTEAKGRKTATVVSSVVPALALSSNGLPETFGIFV